MEFKFLSHFDEVFENSQNLLKDLKSFVTIFFYTFLVLLITQFSGDSNMFAIHFHSYRGSLTTPPFFPTVQWIVYRTPIYVSEKQIAAFRSLRSQDEAKCIVNNYRDIQQPVSAPKVIFARNVLKSKL